MKTNPETQGIQMASQQCCQTQQCCPMLPVHPFMPVNPLLAHAYVPFQCLVCIYPPMKGLEQGTIFPELDRPYGLDPEYTVDA